MRKFIISDLHGCGDIYNTIIGYLENISIVEGEPVHLYINGDLIDRGLDSFDMLMDVKKRCEKNGNVVIHYLAGNHEQLMYDSCCHITAGNLWRRQLHQGGWAGWRSRHD